MTLIASPQNTSGIMVSTTLKKLRFVVNGPNRNLRSAVTGSSATINTIIAAITREISIEAVTRIMLYQLNFAFFFILSLLQFLFGIRFQAQHIKSQFFFRCGRHIVQNTHHFSLVEHNNSVAECF